MLLANLAPLGLRPKISVCNNCLSISNPIQRLPCTLLIGKPWHPHKVRMVATSPADTTPAQERLPGLFFTTDFGMVVRNHLVLLRGHADGAHRLFPPPTSVATNFGWSPTLTFQYSQMSRSGGLAWVLHHAVEVVSALVLTSTWLHC